jgi:hypothetical protein
MIKLSISEINLTLSTIMKISSYNQLPQQRLLTQEILLLFWEECNLTNLNMTMAHLTIYLSNTDSKESLMALSLMNQRIWQD